MKVPFISPGEQRSAVWETGVVMCGFLYLGVWDGRVGGEPGCVAGLWCLFNRFCDEAPGEDRIHGIYEGGSCIYLYRMLYIGSSLQQGLH